MTTDMTTDNTAPALPTASTPAPATIVKRSDTAYVIHSLHSGQPDNGQIGFILGSPNGKWLHMVKGCLTISNFPSYEAAEKSAFDLVKRMGL